MNKSDQTKTNIKTRDIMAIAAMMVLAYAVGMAIGMLTLPIPVLYLYGSAGLVMAFTAIFYLVAANRLNKHGILLVWGSVNGILMALSGYVFMLPYFVLVALVCELAMLGKNTYTHPIRNAIGWSIYGIGMMIGNAIPVWVAWEAFMEKASGDGFSDELFTMEYNMFTNPLLMILACVITTVLSILGCVLGNRILRRHFKKAGVIK